MDTESLECSGFSVIQKNGLPLICDDRFTALGIPHGFTTRCGGVSEGNFESLNLAYSPTRDDPLQNVNSNYDILLNAFGISRRDAVRTNQTHTNVTRRVSRADAGTGLSRPDYTDGVDGLITDAPGIMLMARMADCLPILLYDMQNRAIGAIHSGWKGTIDCIAPIAIQNMHSAFGTCADRLLVSFGPSIGPCCYEVGEEFRNNFVNRHGNVMNAAFQRTQNGLFADIRMINRVLLERCGVKSENISVFTPCTCCTPQHFYSYRRQKEQRGTMSAVIMLPDRR